MFADFKYLTFSFNFGINGEDYLKPKPRGLRYDRGVKYMGEVSRHGYNIWSDVNSGVCLMAKEQPTGSKERGTDTKVTRERPAKYPYIRVNFEDNRTA